MTELSRPVALDRIGAAGIEQVVEARADELEPLARRLMIPAVHRLRCSFRLCRVGEAVVAAAGQLEAEVVQVCVVSLDEFVHELSEEFMVRFVPAGTEALDDDPDAPDEIPYSGARIDLGEAATEQLALALDPYPRKPGTPDPTAGREQGAGPFAALASLRRKQ